MNFTKTIVNAIKYWTNDKLNKKVDKEDFIALKNAKSDWNQNDESADDYIKNRPFYSLGSEEVVTTILPKTTCDVGTESVNLNASLVEGQTYTVTWDDVAYECVARNYEGYLMLGNNAIYEYDGDITTDTGEPFAMEVQGDSTQLNIYAAEENDFTLAISCTEIKENVERLPVKYLPEGYPYKEEFSGKIVENKTVNISATDSPSIDPFEIEFVDGNTYTVVWDGATYECEAYIAPAPNTPSIGSAAVGDAGEGGNGEPFFCTVYEGQVMLFASEVGEHTISISGTTVNIVQMSSEYLPAMNYVSYNEAQDLSTAQMQTARNNIGAGTSSFDGDYNSLINKPFYKVTTQNAILSKTGLSASNKLDHASRTVYYGMFFKLLNGVALEVGKTYTTYYSNSSTALLNPKEWTCYIGSNGFPVIGNEAMMSADNDIVYPNNSQSNVSFCLEDRDNGNGKFYLYTHTTATWYLTITTEDTTVTCLSSEFIGDDIARTSDIPLIDPTLTIEGAAADAKATGDAIYSPKNYITLIDQVNGIKYRIAMRDGELVSYTYIDGIVVTQLPDKITYMAGEHFDSTGMVVSTISTDGVTNEVSNFAVDEACLTEGTTEVSVSYTDESGEVYTTTVPVTVNPFDPAVVLVDFEYTANDDGTYTITDWKGTYNGEVSTEMIIPNYGCIIV